METIAGNRAWHGLSLVLALTAMPLSALAAEPYSPHVGQAYPDNVYWGDTHVHTALSADAYLFGTRLMPDDAYRFAKGEKVRAAGGGGEVRLHRPLDFLVVLDHAENLGVIARIDAGDESLLETEAGKLTVRSLDYPVSLAEALDADTDDVLPARTGDPDSSLDSLRCEILWFERSARRDTHGLSGARLYFAHLV